MKKYLFIFYLIFAYTVYDSESLIVRQSGYWPSDIQVTSTWVHVSLASEKVNSNKLAYFNALKVQLSRSNSPRRHEALDSTYSGFIVLSLSLIFTLWSS